MSDFQNQLDRMKSLMTYGKIEEEKTPSTHTLEYKHIAADGKYYGIVKENSKYYIKYTTDGKETIAESYQYIGGYMNKKNNEYTSYANALKNLEMKLSSINEAQDANVNIATLDPFRREEILAEATDSMKDELARCRQIMYNSSMLMNESTGIGATPFTSQPEAKKENSGDIDTPFTDEVKPDMEFDGKEGGCPKCAGEPFVKGEKGEKCPCGKDVQVKDSVAGQHPSGGKVVRVNEGIDDSSIERISLPSDEEMLDGVEADFPEFDKEDAMRARKVAMQDMKDDEEGEMQQDFDGGEHDDEDFAERLNAGSKMLDDDDDEYEDETYGGENVNSLGSYEMGDIDEEGDIDLDGEEDLDGEDEVDLGAEEDLDLDGEEGAEEDEEGMEEVDETDPESIKQEIERLQALLNDIEGEDEQGEEELEEPLEGEEEPEGVEGEETPEIPVDGEEGLEDECGVMAEEEEKDQEKEEEQMCENKKKYLDNLAKQIVKEMREEGELHEFGNHPGFRKKPMELPETGSDSNEHGADWNDDSVHSEEPFASHIGDGTPFDKNVDKLVDKIFENMIKSGVLKKK